MFVVAESLMQRDLHFRQLAGIEVTAFAAGFGVVGVTLALMGFGVWALVAAHLSQNGLKTAILLAFRRHPRRPMIERRAMSELMYFGGGFTAARIGNYLGVQGDNLVVGRWLGAEALGIYGRAYQLMASPAMLLGQILDRVLFPAMARVQENAERLRAAYRRGVALIALVMLPLSAALYVLAPEVVRFLLGPAWSGAIVPFQIFSLGLLFRTSYKMSDSLARATGAVYRRAWRQWLYALLVIVGAGLGSAWGVEGVATLVLAAIAFNFFLMAQLSLGLAEMTWRSFLAAHVPAGILTLILGVETWGAAAVLRSWHLGALAVLTAAGAVFVLSAVALLRFLPRLVLGEDGLWMVKTLAAYLPDKAGYLPRSVGGTR
jgi:PST family polysaccharide transporter